MTPDRTFAPEVMGMNLVPYMRALQDKDVTFTVTYRCAARSATATSSRPSSAPTTWRSCARSGRCDQIVVNHGTQPLDDLYFELKPLSENLGAVDYDALIDGQPADPERRPQGLPPLPHRRRGGRAQHPRGDLRRAAAGEGRDAQPLRGFTNSGA